MRRYINPTLLMCTLGFAPAIQASRQAALDTKFTKIDSFLTDCPMWDFPAARRTSQYAGHVLPKAPVFHAYNLDNGMRAGHSGLRTPYNLKLPGDFFEALPASIRARIDGWDGFRPDLVDIFLVIQDQPWKESEDLLFRAHYWTDPDAPYSGDYDKPRRIQVGIFEAPDTIRFDKHPAGAFFEEESHVHPEKAAPHIVVSSPSRPAVLGLDPEESNAFWTLVRCGDRAAATLHILLNDADEQELEFDSKRCDSLRALLRELDISMAEEPWVAKVKELLAGPAVTGTKGAPAGDGKATLTVKGSGFTGASAVTIAGRKPGQFRVIDDATLVLTVDRDLLDTKARDIRVTTPMGSNLPPPSETKGEAPTARRNLWLGRPSQTLNVPASGSIGDSFTMPCLPGEVFTAECHAATEGMAKGELSIGIRFDSDAKAGIGWGQKVAGRPRSTQSTQRVPLAVRGTAPEGATQVTFYFEAGPGATPGARALVDTVTCTRIGGPVQLWSGPAALTLTTPASGLLTDSRTVPCKAGDLVTAQARVRTEGMTEGDAQIGIRFGSDSGKDIDWGERMASVPPYSNSKDWISIGRRGKAPAWATSVTFFLQAVPKATPGSRASFDRISWVLDQPGSENPADLWPAAATTTLTVPAGGGSVSESFSVPCAPGDRFTGECQVRTEGMTKGDAMIALWFDTGGKEVKWGSRVEGKPPYSHSATPVALGTQGEAPPGATRVTFVLQAGPGTPGATAKYDSVVFRRVLRADDGIPTPSFLPPDEAPSLTISGGSGKIEIGKTLVLESALRGPWPGHVSYRWLRDGKAVWGGNRASLTLAGVDAMDAGDYVLEATGAKVGTVRSNAVKVTVTDPASDGKAVPAWAPLWIGGAGSREAMTLLPLLTHVPAERDQGKCGNGYVWAAHAAIELELWNRYDIQDRLSVQYFNSVYKPMRAGDPDDACSQGTPELVARTYLRTGFLVPWSNPHAEFQDAGIEDKGGSRAGRKPVSTDPHYRVKALAFEEYSTTSPARTREQITDYIKTQLNDGRIVLTSGSGHYTAIVGYDSRPADPYWIILDSLGARKDRPDGTFKAPMATTAFTGSLEVLSLFWLDLHGRTAAPQVKVTPRRAALTEGDPLQLTAAVTAVPPVRYQWFRNGEPIEGATRSIFSIPSTVPEDSATYGVKVSLAHDGASESDMAIEVEVKPRVDLSGMGLGGASAGPRGKSPVKVEVLPKSLELPAGQEIRLSARVTGTDKPVRYQWLFNGQPVENLDPAKGDLVLAGARTAMSGAYQVEVTDSDLRTVLSDSVHVLVTSPAGAGGDFKGETKQP